MGELLMELLAALAELLAEFLLQLLAGAIVDVANRFLGEIFETPRATNVVVSALSYSVFGALAGVLSISIFPHPLVRPSRIHGISLLVSPLATGLVMSLIGSMLRRRDKRVVQIESFSYGFAFAFGMACVRFLLVK
jgi:hypothetical protein